MKTATLPGCCATFAVDDVEPLVDKPLRTVKAADALQRMHKTPVEACGDVRATYVEDAVPNALAGAVHLAWSGHRPLILTPDAVWLTIVHGVAQHVALDPEKHRAKLVPHAGRERIVVVCERLDWPVIVEEFRAMLAKLALVGRSLTADFSTTGPVERVAQSIALMDVLEPYYQYEVMCVCGIPRVGLAGTPEDWELLRDKVRALPDLDLEWWLHGVRFIADQFARAARGAVNLHFWKRIYKIRDSSGAYDPALSGGWIMSLFPYLVDPKSQAAARRNPLVGTRSEGVTLDALPPGLRDVPLLLEVSGVRRDMALAAGVAGIAEVGLALKPAINWCLREADPRVARLRTLLEPHAATLSGPAPLAHLGNARDGLPADLLIFYRHHDGGALRLGRRTLTIHPSRNVDRTFLENRSAIEFGKLDDGSRVAWLYMWGQCEGILAIARDGSERPLGNKLEELFEKLAGE